MFERERLAIAKNVIRWPAGTPGSKGGEFKQGTGGFKREAQGNPKQKLLHDAYEYEGRLWGGAYSSAKFKQLPKDAPGKKIISAARVAYNAMRKELGLPMVFDWEKRPEKLAQHLLGVGLPKGGQSFPKVAPQISSHSTPMPKPAPEPQKVVAPQYGGGKKQWAGMAQDPFGSGLWPFASVHGAGQPKVYAPPKPPASARPHPKVDDNGKEVLIWYPMKPSHEQTWTDPKAVARFVPGSKAPDSLNGVAMRPYKPPADWASVPGQKPGMIGDDELVLTHGKKAGAGVIVEEPDGRIWIVHPTNGFGGYKATFPKGTVENGLSLQASAIKECYEESGLKVELTGVFGDFERSQSVARYYTAKRVGGTPSDMGWESQAVSLVPRSKLKDILNAAVDKDISNAYATEQILGQSARIGGRSK